MRDSLDELLSSALKEARERSAGRAKAIRESFSQIWSNPENWRAGRFLAVVHRSADGTLTLLGSFREHLHRRVSARKLVRLSEPGPIEGTEYVTGSHWFGGPEPVEFSGKEFIETRRIQLDSLRLLETVSSSHVSLDVRLEGGWIRWAQLAEETTFSCPLKETFIILPQGLHILDAMSFEGKVALRKAVES